MTTNARVLRRRVMSGPVLACPGAANALAALVIEDCGFEAVYVTGAGIANTHLGVPDIGLVTLTELASHVAAIRDAVRLPLVVDADTGFGNPLGVQRTVRVLERAGADAIQLEDQVSPKRCGHFEGKQVVPVADMVARVKAAVDARNDADVLVIARTDARAVEGLDAAVDRAAAYADAGADMTFVEAPVSTRELLSLPTRLAGVPQVANLVEGGRTPPLPLEQLGDFRMVLFANLALQAAVAGMQRALSTLRDTGLLAEAARGVAGWQERQRLVRTDELDALAVRYASAAPEDVGEPSDQDPPASSPSV